MSEAVKLAPRDVEAEGMIRLYDAKGGDGTSYFRPDTVVPVLERWLEIRQHWISAEGVWPGADTFPLLVNRDGRPVSVRYLQRLVKRTKEQLGITGKCTPHVLRHTFATELLGEGFTITEVQSALRHANLQTTAVYLHVRDEALLRKMQERGSRARGKVE